MKRRSVLVLSLSGFTVGAVLLVALMTVFGIPAGLSPRVYWLLGAREYKRAVLSSSSGLGLHHVEWRGDGWGGVGGDWTGYVVYDPTDSLPLRRTDEPAVRVNGIPCDVISVRRLEKDWYSVVTDMNQFWDSAHPGC